jgi:hypothetical protein
LFQLPTLILSILLYIQKNLKCKLKLEDALNPGAALDLIRDIRPFEIPLKDEDGNRINIDLAVPRPFLSKVFGGNSQETYPTIAEKHLRRHGFRGQWMCIKPTFNPYMPSRPGDPGLKFRIQQFDEDLNPITEWKMDICRSFARLASNKWLYLHESEMSYGRRLTADEWQELPQKVNTCPKFQIRTKHSLWIISLFFEG